MKGSEVRRTGETEIKCCRRDVREKRGIVREGRSDSEGGSGRAKSTAIYSKG